MGWQKRSSGRRYVSYSRHAFIIGGMSKGVIGMVIYSKAFKSVMIWVRGDNNHGKIIAQRTLREALKLWRLVQL